MKEAVKSKSSLENSAVRFRTTPRLHCCRSYLESDEGWAACGKWAHYTCAGIDDKDEEAITCEFCQQQY